MLHGFSVAPMRLLIVSPYFASLAYQSSGILEHSQAMSAVNSSSPIVSSRSASTAQMIDSIDAHLTIQHRSHPHQLPHNLTLLLPALGNRLKSLIRPQPANKSHGSLGAPDMELILQAYRQTMQRPDDVAMSLEMRVQGICSLQGLLKENLMKAIVLEDNSRSSAIEC